MVSTLLTQFSAMAAMCRTSDLTPSFIDGLSSVDKRRLRVRLQMTEALGISFFNSGSFDGAWSHVTQRFTKSNHWISPFFLSLRISREQHDPDSSNHSLYPIKLLSSSYPEGKCRGNQL